MDLSILLHICESPCSCVCALARWLVQFNKVFYLDGEGAGALVRAASSESRRLRV